MRDLFEQKVVTLPGTRRVHQLADDAQWAFGNEVHMAQLRAAARASADKRRISAEEKRRRKTERMRRLRSGKKATPEQKAQAMQRRIDALLAAGPKARAISIENRSRRAQEKRQCAY